MVLSVVLCATVGIEAYAIYVLAFRIHCVQSRFLEDSHISPLFDKNAHANDCNTGQYFLKKRTRHNVHKHDALGLKVKCFSQHCSAIDRCGLVFNH